MNYAENDDPQQSKAADKWLMLGVSAAVHPLSYSQVLMQLGYEPIPAVPGRSIFGQRSMILPNYFRYANYIRKTDGLYGCYRGLAPKLVGSIFSMVLSEKIADHLGLNAVVDDMDEDRMTDEELYVQFKLKLKRHVVLNVSGIILAQPFHVISVRMMAQFIGRESLYRSILGSIGEIYRTQGISGFFSGLIPKLLCDVARLVLTSSSIYLLNKYVIKNKIGRQISAVYTHFEISSILYPLSVVATCMTVSGTNLMAGQLPIMPIYKNWLDCFNDLQTRNELKRGQFIFWRTAGSNNGGYVPLPTLAKY